MEDSPWRPLDSGPDLFSNPELIKTLFEDAGDMIWMVDENYHLLYGNRAFREYLGKNAGTSLQKGESVFFSGISDLCRDIWKSCYDRVLLNNESFCQEIETIFKQPPRHFEYSFSPVRCNRLESKAILVTGRELTRHRSLEESLEKVNQLLDQTQNLAHIGGWEWEVTEKRMTWTPETYRIHDMEPGNAVVEGDQLIELSIRCYLPEHREEIRFAFGRCCEEGIPYDLEFPMVTMKGRSIWIRTIGRPVITDGKVIRVFGNIIDISERKFREEQLMVSEEKFRAITQQAGEMLFLHDMQGRVVEVNLAAVRQTGYSKEELMELTVFDIDPDAAERSDPEHIWDELKNQENKRFEVRHRRKNGTVYPAEVNAGKILIGTREYILALVKDLTAQEAAENELRQSEQRSRALVTAIPDMIFRMDWKGIFLNYKAAREDLLVEPEIFIGKSAREVLPEWFANLTLSKIKEALRTNEVQIFEYELPGQHKTLQCFECRMVPDADQEVVAIVRNVTEEREIQGRLAASEAKFRSLFENLSQGVFYQDADGRVTDVNDAALRLFGLTRSQFLGKDSYDERWRVVDEHGELLPPERHPSMVALKTGRPVQNVTVGILIPETGVYNWLIVSAIPQFFSGNTIPCQVFVSMQDITERKKAEDSLRISEQKLFELNQTKDKFFSIIAHDLKSPFNAILGFSDLLVEQFSGQPYCEAQKYAGIIQSSSTRLMALLNNLLDWSRSQTGKMEFNPEYLEVTGLIQENILLMEDAARKKSLELVNSKAGKCMVVADRNMMNAVMRNLISNAIKFSYKGGVITVSTQAMSHEMIVTVADQGVGMTKECIDKLFKIGEACSTKGTMNEHGSGLGLILCKEFIDKHRGRIWAESEPGKGSRLSFTLSLENGIG